MERSTTINKVAPADGLPVISTASKTRLKLSYNKREVIGDYIFRLDRIRKHLMVSHAFDPLRLIFMSELKKIRSVSLKKIYRDIRSSHLSTKRLDEFLESVHLRFDFFEEKDSVFLPLFERNPGHTINLDLLDAKAKGWYKLISGLINPQRRLSGNNYLLPLPLETGHPFFPG